MTTTRRTSSEVAADRQRILDHLTTHADRGWERPTVWMRDTDIAALVKEGKVERYIRKEYDQQPAQNPRFGGSAVCVRYRAYIRIHKDAVTELTDWASESRRDAIRNARALADYLSHCSAEDLDTNAETLLYNIRLHLDAAKGHERHLAAIKEERLQATHAQVNAMLATVDFGDLS